jgi:hypothetical protein
MNERYRWNEEEEGRRARERVRLARDDVRRADRADRAGADRPDLSGRDYYGVSGPDRSHARGENRSWEGREPYPMDVGGINHPGDGDRGMGLDPLTGDRGSAERNSRGYRGVQYGEEAVPQRDRGYSAGEASRGYRSREHYAEGGFEPRGPDRYGADRFDHEREHEARSWWAKARDEFRAWMGDREAERRVRSDHEDDERYARHGGDWQGHDDDTGWRDPISETDRKERRFDEPLPRDFDSRPRGEPREHRPGFFRDDDGRW